MPSTITHAYFALDVYDNLDNKTKKRLKNNIEYLKTFAQGGDILYFYNNINLRQTKKIKELGKYIHRHKTKDFFINLIKYIKNNKLEKKPEVIAFLYGFIMHYALDTTVHPYIFYKTGVFNRKRKITYKYNGLHRSMEMYIDAYMIYTKEGIKPKDFKVHNFCFNVDSFSDNLKNTIDEVFKVTYDYNNIANIYLKAIKKMKSTFYLFKYDPKGIKKLKYHLIDKLLPKSIDRLENISYHIHHKKQIYYLNLEKNIWHHPVDEEQTYDLSFIELYRISIQKCLTMIDKVNKVLYDNKTPRSLDNTFLDISYITGKPCVEKQKLQYFEF